MPTITQIVPPKVRTEAEERAALRPENPPSASKALALALETEWSTGWASRQIDRAGFAADDNWALTKENLEELTDGLPPEYWEDFAGSVSRDHALRIREQNLDLYAKRSELAKLGWKGTALRVAAAVSDPVDITIGVAAGALTGGTGAAAGLATKVSRVGNMLVNGLIGGAAALPVQAYISSQDPEQDEYDVLFSAIGGFGGGAITGALLNRAVAKSTKDLDFNAVTHAMGAASQNGIYSDPKLMEAIAVSPDGRLAFKTHVDGTRQREMVEHMIRTSPLDEEADAATIAELRSMDPVEAVNSLVDESNRRAIVSELGPEPTAEELGVTKPTGASTEPTDAPPPDTRRAGDFYPERASTAPAIWRRFRHSFASILGDDEFDGSSIQFFAAQADDALPRKGGVPSQISATVWTDREHRRIVSEAYRGLDNSFSKWASEPSNGVSVTNRLRKRTEFENAVGRAMRDDPRYIPAGPLKDAVTASRKAIDEAFDLAKRHGLPGFETLEKSSTYFPRIYSASLIQKAKRLYGDDEVDRLFAQAILNSQPKLDPSLAAKIGKGVQRAVLDPDRLTDYEKGAITAGERGDLIEAVLRENGIDEETILDVLYAVKPGSPEAATVSRAKHRIRLDEGTTIETANGRLTFADILDNNVGRVVNGYARQLSGASAAHRTYQLVSKGPEDIVANWDQAARRLKNQLREAGVSEKKIENAIGLARTLDRSVRGLPMDETFSKTTRDNMRRIRSINHIALSGGFGWAQVPEIAQVVGEAGIRATFAQLPTLTRIFKVAREGGKLDDEFLRTIEATFGTGTDRLLARFTDPLEDAADQLDMFSRRADTLLHAGQRVANDLSLTAPITMLSQRISVASALQFVWQAASRDTKLSASKLATMGLSDADWSKIKAAVRDETGKAVKVERGPLLGKRVADYKFHEFKDEAAATLLIDTVDRWTKQMIQKTDIGNLPPWMSKDWGKLLFQFKSFAFTAWEKQLLRGVYAHDARTFSAFGMATGLAAIVYTARTHVNSVGRADREEYLAKKLSDRAIIAAAFQNAGYSSLLPSFIETFNKSTGGPPIFTARHTGLDANLLSLDNNPTISNLNASVRLFGDALAPILPWSESSTFTQKEANGASRLIPYRNVIGIRNVIDAMISQLPESEQ